MSFESTNTTYSSAISSEVAPRNGRASMPSTWLPSFGENEPFFVVTVHSASVDLITNMVFFTLLSEPQNGHVAEARDSNDVRSIQPSPPVHAFASFAGSFPANEKRH